MLDVEKSLSREAYPADYLAWADQLIGGQKFGRIIYQLNQDRQILADSRVVFEPDLQTLTARLDLRVREDHVPHQAIARGYFSQHGLEQMALTTAENFSVLVRPSSASWPVGLNRTKQPLDQERDYLPKTLIKSAYVRELVDRVVSRVAFGIDFTVEQCQPIARVSPALESWPIDYSELRPHVKTALAKQGLETFYDLGRLSLAQLRQIPRLSEAGEKEILDELANRGWR